MITFDVASFGERVWFTADLHLGHSRILELTNRPFKNINKHDNALIKNARSVVRPKDLYIVVGDLNLANTDNQNKTRRYIERLPGVKVLVLGNHDRLPAQWYNRNGFAVVATSLILPGGILVTHDIADAVAWPNDKPVICGHVHGILQTYYNIVNVGVDARKGYPVSYVDALMSITKTPRPDYDWEYVSKNRHTHEDIHE
jgi:calcineurin-like phosphoesterase family protein